MAMTGGQLAMSSERTECRLAAMEMSKEAAAHGYKDQWALVAVAGGILELAAAVWELVDFLAWAHDERRPEVKRR